MLENLLESQKFLPKYEIPKYFRSLVLAAYSMLKVEPMGGFEPPTC